VLGVTGVPPRPFGERVMVLEQCGIVAAPAEPCGLRFGADIK
jgi:hypothetical protein